MVAMRLGQQTKRIHSEKKVQIGSHTLGMSPGESDGASDSA